MIKLSISATLPITVRIAMLLSPQTKDFELSFNALQTRFRISNFSPKTKSPRFRAESLGFRVNTRWLQVVFPAP